MLARFLNSLTKPVTLLSARSFYSHPHSANPLNMGISYSASKESQAPLVKGPGPVVESSVCVEDSLKARRDEIMLLKLQEAAKAAVKNNSEQETKPAMRR